MFKKITVAIIILIVTSSCSRINDTEYSIDLSVQEENTVVDSSNVDSDIVKSDGFYIITSTSDGQYQYSLLDMDGNSIYSGIAPPQSLYINYITGSIIEVMISAGTGVSNRVYYNTEDGYISDSFPNVLSTIDELLLTYSMNENYNIELYIVTIYGQAILEHIINDALIASDIHMVIQNIEVDDNSVIITYRNEINESTVITLDIPT